MINKTYVWNRPNEKVKFKGFSKEELSLLSPALYQTDLNLKDNKRLNATFVKKNPVILPHNKRVAAETRYLLGGRAKVYMNPEVFRKNKYEWNPSGVASHEIGHLVGPTRGTSMKERHEFRKAFSYRQKKIYHEFAPSEWKKRRENPLKGLKTRQSINASEDFAESFRSITGEPFTNRTNSDYFSVVLTPQRVNYMKKHVVK